MLKFDSEEERQMTRLKRTIEYYDKLIDYCIKHKMRHYSNPFRNVVFFILSNDIKEIANSIIVLYENNSRIGIDALDRMAFEKLLFILLTKNSENKAKAYFLKMQMRQYEHMSNLLNDMAYSESFSKLSGIKIDLMKKELLKKYPNFYKNKESLFEEYRCCYDYEISNDNVFRHKWYNFSQKTNSIKKLADEVGLSDEYRIQYDINSSEVHSLGLKNYYKFLKEEDRSYIALLTDNDKVNEIDGIVFISGKLYEVILILFDIFKVPKKKQKEFNDAMRETIDLGRHMVKRRR